MSAYKNHYFVGTRMTKDGKLYCFTITATTLSNLADPSLWALNVFDSKQKADAYRDYWNMRYEEVQKNDR